MMEGRDFGRASTEELSPVPHAIGADRKLRGWFRKILLVDNGGKSALRHVVKTIMACSRHSIRISAARFAHCLHRGFVLYEITMTPEAPRKRACGRIYIGELAIARDMEQSSS